MGGAAPRFLPLYTSSTSGLHMALRMDFLKHSPNGSFPNDKVSQTLLPPRELCRQADSLTVRTSLGLPGWAGLCRLKPWLCHSEAEMTQVTH